MAKVKAKAKLKPKPKLKREAKAQAQAQSQPKTKPKVKAKRRVKRKTAQHYRRAFEKVCDLITSGARGESVKTITASPAVGVSSTKFYTMLRTADGELAERYARAREAQAHRLVEDMVEIADDAGGDFEIVVKRGREGNKRDDFEVKADQESVNRARLRIDTRKWVASRLNPKVYGDRQRVDVSHGLEKMNDDELLARAKQLADSLGITLPKNLIKPARHQSNGD